MEFWQGFVIGVIVTQIFLGFVLVKAGVIADVIRYLESGLTKRAPDGATAPRIFRTVDQIFKHYIKGYARPPRR